MYEEEKDTSWSFALGLLVGAAVGAGLAGLYTPRSGPQNREAVIERGLVLRDRMSSATTSATTRVKGTTSGALSSVKDTTSSVVSRVSETASTTVGKVQDATSTAAEKVSATASTAVEKVQDVASTAAEKVSATVERVQEAASTAAEKVSETASTAAEKAQSVAGTAAEKARNLTGRGQTTEEFVVPTPETLASEARYDAEDVRPATTSSAATTPLSVPASSAVTTPLSVPTASDVTTPAADQLSTLASIDTFEPKMGETAAITTEELDVVLADPAEDPIVEEAVRELASDEQFEISEAGAAAVEQPRGETNSRTVAGTDADVREASEGAERGG